VETPAEIKHTLSAPAAPLFVRDQAASGSFAHRLALADFLCDHCGFHDARGFRQRNRCLKALRALAARGALTRPALQRTPGAWQPRHLARPVPEPTAVPAEVSELRDLQLVLVTTEAERRVWAELMLDEPPRGAGPLVGRQLRYLIGSAAGWLGGVGIGPAALQLVARHRWIGWMRAQRGVWQRTLGRTSRRVRPITRCRWPRTSCEVVETLRQARRTAASRATGTIGGVGVPPREQGTPTGGQVERGPQSHCEGVDSLGGGFCRVATVGEQTIAIILESLRRNLVCARCATNTGNARLQLRVLVLFSEPPLPGDDGARSCGPYFDRVRPVQ
jgi:hypothetical protein